MNLWQIIPEDCRTLSVVGMAKNTGKTVTLNRLITEGVNARIPLGLTSIGRDGEKEDVVTGTEKPGISVIPGTLLATTDLCLQRSTARTEILHTTQELTPMGQVVLARVRQSGEIELAGPNTNQGIQRVCQLMQEMGAGRILVDGAINRISSASPAVTDGCILATGAALGRNMQQVVRATVYQVSLLKIPSWKGSAGLVEDDMDKILPTGCAAGIMDDENRLRFLPISTVLTGGKEIARNLKEHDTTVFIRGGLTNATVRDFLNSRDGVQHITLVVENATKIFMEERDWRIAGKRGLQVKVLQAVRLIMVTINPWSPGGWEFDASMFQKTVSEGIYPIPAINILGRGEEK